jgi:2-dehydropantoate 2-reductase
VIVYGAGAVGGVVGARLAQAGNDVTLIARGAHRDAIAANGLRLRTPAEDTSLPIPVAGHPSELDFGDDDVVLLTMKSQDTPDALVALSAAAPPMVAVACLQNGVANERMASRYFERVYAVPVMLPATHLEPGVVEATSTPTTGILDVGTYPTGVDDTARELSACFAAATFSSQPDPQVMRLKHSKLIMNLGNAVQAVCAPSEASTELVKLARREGAACLRAAGVEVATAEEDRARRADHLSWGQIDGRARSGGSTWQSLARAVGSVETDYLNGEIVLLGRLHGFPTPVNALLQRTAAGAAHAGLPPESLDAAELLAELAAHG